MRKKYYNTGFNLIDWKEIKAICEGGENYVLDNFAFPFDAEMQNAETGAAFAQRKGINQSAYDAQRQRMAEKAVEILDAARRP